jgi:hypothetical protein
VLTIYEAEKLEIAKKLLEEVSESEGFKTLDYHPDLHLADALQAIDELLSEYYPEGYVLPETIAEASCHIRPWHEKLKNTASTTLGEISGILVITAALSACTSLFCWGLSGAKDAFGYTARPDFAAQSQIYRGVAIASIGAALGCGVVGSVINETRK